jgi:hypothetical protein
VKLHVPLAEVFELKVPLTEPMGFWGGERRKLNVFPVIGLGGEKEILKIRRPVHNAPLRITLILNSVRALFTMVKETVLSCEVVPDQEPS